MYKRIFLYAAYAKIFPYLLSTLYLLTVLFMSCLSLPYFHLLSWISIEKLHAILW